ncbi:MAG: amidohydrolase family protein [Actinobacteria bacterium]|nr:amidohydrolase family protein [Actinomycetota bacterium]MSW77597.1 amidohydrolase family protein [Actinomycetota bacterium]MSX57170.1 amidohydrolase family protein [Actinomycetota bacterium]MSX93651.1 amidohydrolase family protein [Actinomycetota bacterium]MSZ82479.1 amidohydrolase family protein [Actinomycetota bacterium]
MGDLPSLTMVTERAEPAPRPLSITNALLTDGRTVTVRLADGLVHAIDAPTQPGDDVLDADGRLLLPAMAEAHAHLDKAFLAETVPNPTGDLMGAILAIDAARDRITLADTEERAERAARLIAANGATAIRTHADIITANGFTSLTALLAVRDRLRDLVHIEVIALSGWPSVGPAAAEQQALLREAVAMGVDGIGGCPHLEDDPAAANDLFLTIAAESGLPVDLHTDETLVPERFALEDLADRVLATGFPHRVAASHCVSLGMQPEAVQRRVAEKVAAAGISVIALPSSNLFLQGRDQQHAMPRALTAIRALREAGVNLAAGADNLQDPFNPVGRGDCLETASLMVMAGHQLPAQAYHSVSAAVRRLMGLPAAAVSPGATADLVLIPAASVREAIALAPAGRIVIRGGRRVDGW